jgi:DNA-binding NtrC family response regulator
LNSEKKESQETSSQQAEKRLIRADRKASVLLVDPDPLTLTALAATLDMEGYRAVMARTAELAFSSLAAEAFDVVTLTIDELSFGCKFAERIRKQENTRDIPIIFVVPPTAQDWAEELSKQGGVFSIQAPVDPEELSQLVDRALVLPHIARVKSGRQGGVVRNQSDWMQL